MQRLRRKWRPRLCATCQAALSQPPNELVEAVTAEERLVLEDHQRHAAVACPRHAISVIQPALVDLLNVFANIFDCVVVTPVRLEL